MSFANPTTTSETTSIFVTQKLYDEISGSEKHLIVIETARVPDVVQQFRQFAMRSGGSLYLWTEDVGITNLREADLPVPGSQRLHDALRHVANSLHPGVYVFIGFGKQLRPPATSVVRQLARQTGPGAKKVVFVDAKVRLPEGLDVFVNRIVHVAEDKKPPRLRDGRWVF